MIIEARDLRKFYRTDVVETTAVNGVDFTQREGEFVSIMGPSGCGKSTLLRENVELLDGQVVSDQAVCES